MSDTPAHGFADRSPDAVHLPGGRLRHEHWTGLAALASEHGGEISVTSRGRLRVHGADGSPVSVDRFSAAGLPARVGSDRARDIIASPLAGRLVGHGPIADLPDRLDEALHERAGTVRLDRQVLFGIDDGSCDVLAHAPDLTAVVDPTGTAVRVHVAGRDVSVHVAPADATTVLADVAVEFAARSDLPSRVPGSGAMHDLVVDALRSHPLTSPAPQDPPPTTTAAAVPSVGWVDTADGMVSLLAVVAHGVIPARLAEFLGAIERPSTVSADQVIGLHELTEQMAEQVVRVLAPMGMIFDAGSEWVRGEN